MNVVSFRVPKELKKAMKEVDVNWSEEIRKFIEKKLENLKKENFGRNRHYAGKCTGSKKGTAKNYVREDRDSN